MEYANIIEKVLTSKDNIMIIKEDDPNIIKLATQTLKNDGIICLATETVYALICDATSNVAVQNLYKIKQRNQKKPIAIFVSNLRIAKKFLYFNPTEEKIAKKFMPGMITIVLNRIHNTKLSKYLNDNGNSLGLRIPDHKFCLSLLSEFENPIAATSANLSNAEPANNFYQACKYFEDKVDLIIDGGVCRHKIASTVLIVEDEIKILRQGIVTQNELNSCKI